LQYAAYQPLFPHQIVKGIRTSRRPTVDTRRHCIGTNVRPLAGADGAPTDADTSWQTIIKEEIVPVRIDKITTKPQLITFDAFGTLIAPSQSIGRWYREALNSVCDMRIRLPRPALFFHAFKAVYKDMCSAHPCFGARTGLTSEEWWYRVIEQTYLTTRDIGEVEAEEVRRLMPELFEILYSNVFNSKEGWILKEDVEYTLIKLAEWRDMGAGPKVGVLSNFDDRLHKILKELDVAKYFDFILTSYESKEEKPQTGVFNKAMQLANCDDPALAYHVGDDIETDIEGAFCAGWTALRYNEWFDNEFPDWYAIEDDAHADEGADSRRALLLWGRKAVNRHPAKGGLQWIELWGLDDILTLFGFPDDPTKPIKATVLRGILEDEAPSQSG